MIRDPKIKDIRAVADSVEALDFSQWFPYSKITVEDRRSFADGGFTIYLWINDVRALILTRSHGGLKVNARLHNPAFLQVFAEGWYRNDDTWVGTYKDVAQRAVARYAEAVDFAITELSEISDPTESQSERLEVLWRMKLGQPTAHLR